MVHTKKAAGFTLIEVLVSIVIVGIIAIALMSLNASNAERSKREQFQSNVESILSFLRTARTNAITNAEINGSTPDGFGVYIKKAEDNKSIDITLFADIDDGTGNGNGDNKYDAGADTVIDSKSMISTNWQLALENPNPSSISLDKTLTIIFTPPDAEMVINDNTTDNDLVSVEITGTYKSTVKRICLNRISEFFEILTGESC